jgi:YggT family protein
MVGQTLYLLLYLYFFVLIGRLVFDWVQVFSRDWRPKGPVLVLANGIYTLTDPPLRALRKIIPPLRIGGIALDLGFIVLIIGVSIARSLALALPI